LLKQLSSRQFSFKKGFTLSILGTDGWSKAIEDFEGPRNVEGGVIPEDGAFALRIVEVSGLVENLGGLGENQKTMGKPFRNPKRLEVSGFCEGFEVKPGPFAEVRRVGAEVDRDVPDVPRDNANEFPLGLTKLIVEPAENSPSRKRLVILNELSRETRGSEGFLIENFREPAATIAKALGLNKFDIVQRSIDDMHPSSLSTTREGCKLLWNSHNIANKKRISEVSFA
jgi:hypothetical protein